MMLFPTRRDLFKSALAAGAVQLIGSISETLVAEAKPHAIGDRLWLWCHYEGSHNGSWGIPASSSITPVEAAAYMAIPNAIMVGYEGKPVAPFDQYAVPFHVLREVVWSVVGAGGTTHESERDMVLNLAAANPNFAGVIMDDFFTGAKEGSLAALTVAQLRELQDRLKGGKRKLDLWVTLYTHQLDSPIEEHMQYVDVATLWAWTAPEIDQLPENLAKAERLFPRTRKVLGCYMWDYGRSKSMPVASMKRQCDLGLDWLNAGRIDGMVFLASCICDLNLETVEWTREWIREHNSIELARRKFKG
jgi:hypothetical protein